MHQKVKCEECNQEICNAFLLKRHMGKVHGLKPSVVFQCEFCPMFYNKQANLTKHVDKNHRSREFNLETHQRVLLVIILFLHTKNCYPNYLTLIQGILQQSVISNLALVRIQILIFANIVGPMCFEIGPYMSNSSAFIFKRTIYGSISKNFLFLNEF